MVPPGAASAAPRACGSLHGRQRRTRSPPRSAIVEALVAKGTIVTVDALNCQRAIAAQIIDQWCDYAFALKGNQGTLHTDVAVFLDDPLTKATTEHTTVDADHGRIETRGISVSTDIDWLQNGIDGRPGSDRKVTRTRETGDKIHGNSLLSIQHADHGRTRRRSRAQPLGRRDRLHWRLDVTMNEDAARNRMDNGPHNLAVLRHMGSTSWQEESKTSYEQNSKSRMESRLSRQTLALF